MRIFITCTEDDGSTRTTRIFIGHMANTSALLKEISREIGVATTSLIVKLKNEPYHLRILDNWPLTHYPLRNGSTLIVQFNDNSTCRELSLSTQPLARVQEEDDFDSADERPLATHFRQHSARLDETLKSLLQAVQRGDLEQTAHILREQPSDDEEDDPSSALQQRHQYLLSELGDSGRNALHQAIKASSLDIVSFLLIKGADPSLLTADQYSPLQLAVLGRSPEILSVLLHQTRIDVNQVTPHGTALHLATAQEDLRCMETLFQGGADPEAADEEGKRAIELSRSPAVRKLLQRKTEMRKGSVPYISKGGVFKVTSLTYRLKERVLLINSFRDEFSLQNIPKQTEDKFLISLIDAVEEVEERSWLMSSGMCYFKVTLKDKEKTELLLAVKNQTIMDKWVGSFRAALRFRQDCALSRPVPASEQLIEAIDDNTNSVTLHHRRVQTPKKTMSILNLLPDEEEGVQRIKSRLSMRKSDRRFVNFSEEYVMDESQIVLGSVVRPGERSSGSGQEYASIVESAMEPSFLEKTLSTANFRKNSLNRSDYLISEFKPEGKIVVSFRDFEIVRLLGTGAFGQVFQAKYKGNGRIYALKVLSKQKLIKKKQLKYAVGEATILKKLNFPFIVTLHFAFQTPHNLYLALDHCPRGDLAQFITVRERLTEPTARFFIAQIVLAVEYLHSKNVLYRDLKPENILMGEDGYVRLTDFGLSRENSFSLSFCGSPAYLSPEMLERKGVGFPSDIYGIGCILFQMLTGQPPFFDDNVETLYDNIKYGRLRFPSHLSPEAASILAKLLERDPTKRLGSKNFGDIKIHDFFRKTDWTALLERRVPLPQELAEEPAEIYFDVQLEQAEELRLNDVDYEPSTEKINRIKHFTFVRESPTNA